jgi:predicted DNA-binding transcriptional regulator AlpA
MDLLTTEQAATKLGLSERTLEAWRFRGEGPPFLRVGPRRVAYSLNDLDSWLRLRRCDPDTARAQGLADEQTSR